MLPPRAGRVGHRPLPSQVGRDPQPSPTLSDPGGPQPLPSQRPSRVLPGCLLDLALPSLCVRDQAPHRPGKNRPPAGPPCDAGPEPLHGAQQHPSCQTPPVLHLANHGGFQAPWPEGPGGHGRPSPGLAEALPRGPAPRGRPPGDMPGALGQQPATTPPHGSHRERRPPRPQGTQRGCGHHQVVPLRVGDFQMADFCFCNLLACLMWFQALYAASSGSSGLIL